MIDGRGSPHEVEQSLHFTKQTFRNTPLTQDMQNPTWVLLADLANSLLKKKNHNPGKPAVGKSMCQKFKRLKRRRNEAQREPGSRATGSLCNHT